MRSTAILSFAVLAACSSHAPPAASPSTGGTVRVTGGTNAGNTVSSMRTGDRNDLYVDTLWVPLDRVWRVMPAVYNALEIQITTFDAEKNTIGNAGMKVYRRLGKTPLTRYLDCGRTQIGQSAESYDIQMSVLTRLTPVDSGRTVVSTNIEAAGRPMQFAGGETQCRTKGALEGELLLVLKARLQG